ncbi:MAG: glycoside hydrolase family 38 C-terminal domain-containing protein [Ferruginibacter sp.]|nr:glycoside hydrolase family 38 C-terminal domain-containing protein [Ferruginibacter sp.]
MIKRNSTGKLLVILVTIQLCAAWAKSQDIYFIDGYHGGVYGHYPKQYTRYITKTLEQNPAWNINLEIEPETWDTVRVNEPENYARFKKYFNDDQSVGGRIEYVNPAYGQAYFYNINGESIIRQFQYGIKKLREHFPNAAFTTYSSEEPCFTSALPQILSSFGFKYASLKNPNTCWGGYTRAFGGEVINWVGPDGTKILTVPRYAVEALDPHSTWQTLASVNAPSYLAAALQYGIQNPVGMCLQDAGWQNGPWLSKKTTAKVLYTTWRNYLTNVVTRKPTQNWHFSQEDVQVSLVWGAQVLQKIAKEIRISENKIGRAEKLAVMANVYAGTRVDTAGFDEAWRGILLAQHHDCWIVPYNGRKGNTWVDKVEAWTGMADSIADHSIQHSVNAIQGNKTTGDTYIRVFNTNATDRRELVKVSLPANLDDKITGVADSKGKQLAAQVIADGDKKILVFTATVPSMGYATYRLARKQEIVTNANHITKLPDGNYRMESDLYTIIVDPSKGGTIKSLVAKKLHNKEFVDASHARGFNEMWGYFFKDKKYVSSRDQPAEVTILADGSQYISLQVNGHINGNPFTQTISLSRGQSLIDLSLTIDWQTKPGIGSDYKQEGGYNAEDYQKAFYNDTAKLQTLFPLNLRNQQVYKNAPFDVTKSALENTFFNTWDSIKNNVLLNWVDVTDGVGKYGLALFSDHTTSYAQGPNFPLGLTTQYAGVGLWGRNYSVTMPTTLHYALVPHEGLWNKASLWSLNNNWDNPMETTMFQSSDKLTSLSRSLVAVSNKNIELTSVTKDGDDMVVRIFNADNKAGISTLTFDGLAENTKLEELNGKTKSVLKASVNGSKTMVTVTYPKFGIRTIRLKNFKANQL